MYTACLAEAAYYIESEGEVAIIDPIRETEPYTSKAMERNSKIKFVFETHFHADFVSGHLDLAKQTGAELVFGPNAKTGYQITQAADEQIFKLGKITIKVLHTPGHTPESTCYLLFDENNKPHAIFSGDTLFVGDVGRPDLTTSSDLTPEILAGQMYDSIRNKILPLPDDVIVYPGHGAGSSCGKNLGKETWSTIGEQRKSNYALQNIDKKTFVSELIDGLTPPPQYFFEDAKINQNGYESLDVVLKRNLKPLEVLDALAEMNNGALVLDTRSPEEFSAGYIPNSINIGLDGTFAVWVGALIPIQKRLIIVADENRVLEVMTRLARVGYENVVGYVKGGFDSWKAEGLSVEVIENISADEFNRLYNSKPNDFEIIDVRKLSEYQDCHLASAKHFPLDSLEKNIKGFNHNSKFMVHCAGGYRSMMAASIMKYNEIDNVINISGGMSKIKEASPELLVVGKS